jgi:hypothetical protein
VSTPLDRFIDDAAARPKVPGEVAFYDQGAAMLVDMFACDGVDVTDPTAARAALSGALYASALLDAVLAHSGSPAHVCAEDHDHHPAICVLAGLCDHLGQLAKAADAPNGQKD